MKLFTLILLLFTQSVFCCDLQLPGQLLIFNGQESGKNSYLAKNCSSLALNDFHRMLSELDGKVKSIQLVSSMRDQGHEITLAPELIFIQQFHSVVKDKLQLPLGIKLLEASAKNVPGMLALSTKDRIEILCDDCLHEGQRPFRISIRGFDGSNQDIFATAQFKKLVRAYRLKTSLPSFSTLTDSHSLQEDYVEEIPHTELLTNIDSLKFYRTNKPLKEGEILKISDLNAINLVRAGVKTDVIIENKMIRIKTSGIGRGNGSIGELVEVFHPQKNKMYLGKVIDINTVLVEL